MAVVVIGAAAYFYLAKSTAIPAEQTGIISEEPVLESTSQHAISIENFAYSPEELTISVGETVTWTNKDGIKHDVASDEGNELGSKLLSPNESYSHTFNAAGEYSYHCSPHPFMKGKIIVQ